MSAWAQNVLTSIARSAEAAAKRLDDINLSEVPSDIAKRVAILWEERPNFVKGVQELVEGLNNLQAALTTIQRRQENLEVRVQTLETQLAVFRGREPPPPPPRLEDAEVWLEDTEDGSNES